MPTRYRDINEKASDLRSWWDDLCLDLINAQWKRESANPTLLIFFRNTASDLFARYSLISNRYRYSKRYSLISDLLSSSPSQIKSPGLTFLLGESCFEIPSQSPSDQELDIAINFFRTEFCIELIGGGPEVTDPAFSLCLAGLSALLCRSQHQGIFPSFQINPMHFSLFSLHQHYEDQEPFQNPPNACVSKCLQCAWWLWWKWWWFNYDNCRAYTWECSSLHNALLTEVFTNFPPQSHHIPGLSTITIIIIIITITITNTITITITITIT